MVIYLEKYVTILKQNQLKITPQRLAIMKYLDEHRTHPTADRIYIDLKEKNPALSKTTVYNSVETLKEHGIIQSLTISGSDSAYQWQVISSSLWTDLSDGANYLGTASAEMQINLVDAGLHLARYRCLVDLNGNGEVEGLIDEYGCSNGRPLNNSQPFYDYRRTQIATSGSHNYKGESS